MTCNFLRIAHSVVLVAMLACAGVRPANAQKQTPAAAPTSAPLKIGVYISPPFVMKEDGEFKGMAIDLWSWLADQLDLRYEYVELDSPHSLIEATASGEIDVAVTNLSVTKKRVKRIDFTYPWFDGGLRIMVNDHHGSSFGELVAGLARSGHLLAFTWIALVIIVASVILTVFDRRFDEGFPRRWRDGVAESFYTVMSIATSGRPPSRKNLFGWVGRIWQGIWLVCGIAVLAYVTSSVTSVMTTLSLTNQINSIADLSDRTVGVRAGSIAEEYAREIGLNVQGYSNITEAVDDLLDGEVAALVGDSPVLKYYAHIHPEKHVTVTGTIFKPDKNAFGLPRGSKLRRPLTVQLVGARRGGRIKELKIDYFGEVP